MFPVAPVKAILSMFPSNNNPQWTEDAKGELNVSTQNSIFSHVSKIEHCIVQAYYVV